jgi:hypothetical protein
MQLAVGDGDTERRATMPLPIRSSRFTPLVLLASTFLLATIADAQQGKWLRKAPFPEPSEELLGAAADGKLYVFAGLAPGWKPKALVYEYEPSLNTRARSMRSVAS